MDTTNLSSVLKILISISTSDYMFVTLECQDCFTDFYLLTATFKFKFITKIMFIVIDLRHMFPRLFLLILYSHCMYILYKSVHIICLFCCRGPYVR